MTKIDAALLSRLAEMQFDVKGEQRGLPTGKMLAMLVRPSFIAPIGRTLVWGDWSAIEARVLPWLAASPGAEKVLDIFRESDHDKTKPDIYMMTACMLTGDDPVEMWKAIKDKKHPQHQYAKMLRQAQGKVPVLSLGFGGGLGALQAMAVNYGVFLDDEKAKWTVDTWRATNPWARQFWGKHDRDGSSGLWGAVNKAVENPGQAFEAGRVAFVYDAGYMGGTLFCALPCGRLLTYPDIKWRTRTFKDKKTGEQVEKTALWYKKGYGYSALWHGKVCLAQDTVVATNRGWLPIIEVRGDDLLWDGLEWVKHGGLIYQGSKSTMPVEGVYMTADHKVLTHDGWHEAKYLTGHDRLTVRVPPSLRAGTEGVSSRASAVARSMRLWVHEGCIRGRMAPAQSSALAAILRVSNEAADRRREHDPWHDEAPGFCSVALYAGSVSATHTPSVEELRGSRHYGLREVAELREFLERHGSELCAWPDAGASGQRSGLQPGKLQVGDTSGAGEEPSQEDVFDLTNAGPRRRFTVLGDHGPMLVHNCENVTQATAGSILRETLVMVDEDEELRQCGAMLTGHVHDEVLLEAPEGDPAVQASERLKALMTTKPAWRETLPLVVEMTTHDWYTKMLD